MSPLTCRRSIGTQPAIGAVRVPQRGTLLSSMKLGPMAFCKRLMMNSPSMVRVADVRRS